VQTVRNAAGRTPSRLASVRSSRFMKGLPHRTFPLMPKCRALLWEKGRAGHLLSKHAAVQRFWYGWKM
jgi:hypothetical protein